MTFGAMTEEFGALNTQLIGLSIDSVYSHIAWLRRIKELAWKDLKHIEVTFPVIADITMETAKMYGMLHPSSSDTQTVRAVFIIDPEGIIRCILYYPSTTGRNMEEIKRIVLALQKADHEKIATPANWMPGDDVILPPPGTCNLALERTEKVNENIYCIDWFLCFKQSNGEMSEPEHEREPEANPYPTAYPVRRRVNNNRRIY
jgi:peroxiredoxin (alkyl hydroperoxide reductase subunit C)